MTDRAAIRSAFMAIIALTAACSGSPSAAAQGGEFTAVVTGAATATLQGFAPSSGRTGAGWTVQMETPGADNVIVFFRDGAGRPDPGMYGLVDFTTGQANPAATDLVASVQLHSSILAGGGFDTVRGTLTVTASSDASVEGEFTLTAHHSSNPSRSVTVSGSFKSHNKPT